LLSFLNYQQQRVKIEKGGKHCSSHMYRVHNINFPWPSLYDLLSERFNEDSLEWRWMKNQSLSMALRQRDDQLRTLFVGSWMSKMDFIKVDAMRSCPLSRAKWINRRISATSKKTSRSTPSIRPSVRDTVCAPLESKPDCDPVLRLVEEEEEEFSLRDGFKLCCLACRSLVSSLKFVLTPDMMGMRGFRSRSDSTAGLLFERRLSFASIASLDVSLMRPWVSDAMLTHTAPLMLMMLFKNLCTVPRSPRLHA
jgi:hypothetical protein